MKQISIATIKTKTSCINQNYHGVLNRGECNRFREQGWCSGESTPLRPMWTEFESWRRRHMWVEFVVGSDYLAPRGFSPSTPVFPSP